MQGGHRDLDGKVVYVDEVVAVLARREGEARLPLPGGANHLAEDRLAAQVVPVDVVAAQPSEARRRLGVENPHDRLAQRVLGDAVQVLGAARRRRADRPLVVAHLVHRPHDRDARAAGLGQGPDELVVPRQVIEVGGGVVREAVAVAEVDAGLRGPELGEQGGVARPRQHVARHERGAGVDVVAVHADRRDAHAHVEQRAHDVGADVAVRTRHQNMLRFQHETSRHLRRTAELLPPARPGGQAAAKPARRPFDGEPRNHSTGQRQAERQQGIHHQAERLRPQEVYQRLLHGERPKVDTIRIVVLGEDAAEAGGLGEAEREGDIGQQRQHEQLVLPVGPDVDGGHDQQEQEGDLDVQEALRPRAHGEEAPDEEVGDEHDAVGDVAPPHHAREADHAGELQDRRHRAPERDRRGPPPPHALAAQGDQAHRQDEVHRELDQEGPQRAVDRVGVHVVGKHPGQGVLRVHQAVEQIAPRPRVCQIVRHRQRAQEGPQHEGARQRHEDQPREDAEHPADEIAERVGVALVALRDQVSREHEEHLDGERGDLLAAYLGDGKPRQVRHVAVDDRRGGDEADDVDVVAAVRRLVGHEQPREAASHCRAAFCRTSGGRARS